GINLRIIVILGLKLFILNLERKLIKYIHIFIFELLVFLVLRKFITYSICLRDRWFLKILVNYKTASRRLAYWAMDDGYKSNSGFVFSTNSFTLTEVQLLINTLKTRGPGGYRDSGGPSPGNFDLNCSQILLNLG